MTFSIVARCRETGMFGVAVSSSSPAVGARCPYARAGTGAVSSQNVTDPALGPGTLDRMAAGDSAREAVEAVIQGAEHASYRQLLAVDTDGASFVYSGAQVLGVWSQVHAQDVACAGNLLANEGIPSAMLAAFRNTPGHLADRLIEAMRSALRAGGEEGPVHSAALKIVREVQWPIVDLRVDWCESCPIEALSTVWEIYKPQVEAYVVRALDPPAAPSYGVPGNE